MPGNRSKKAIVLLVFFSRFLIYAQRMVVAPFFYRLMDRFNVGYVEMGALLTFFFIGYAATQLPARIAADHYQARHVIITGLLVLMLGSLGFVYSGSFSGALAARLFMGAGAALCYSPGMKIVASNSTYSERGGAIGVVQMAVGVSLFCTMTVFPLIIDLVGLANLFLSLTFLSPVLIGFYLVMKPHSESAVASTGSHASEPSSAVSSTEKGIAALFREPWKNLVALLVVAALGLFAANGVSGWLPSFINKPLGYGDSGSGIIIGVMLVFDTFASHYSGRLSDDLGRRLVVVNLGAGITIAGLLLLLLSPRGWLVYLTVIILGLGMGSIMTPLVTLASELYGARRAGFVISTMNTVGQSASAISGVLLGYLIEVSGRFGILWIVGAVSLALRAAATVLIRENPEEQMSEA